MSRWILAGLLLMCVGCPDDTLIFSLPRIELRESGQASHVTLHIRSASGDDWSDVGYPDLRKDCPCDGRTVDVRVTATEPLRVVVLARTALDRVIGRADAELTTAAGLRVLQLLPVGCQDDDGDGFCVTPNGPGLPADCDDSDFDLSPLTTCVAKPTPDVPPPVEDVAEPDIEEVSEPVDPGAEPDTGPLNPGELGDPCGGGTDCLSGHCFPTRDGQRCTRECESGDDCSEGLACTEVQLPGADRICLATFLNLCRPCGGDLECPGFGQKGVCLSMGDAGSFCGGRCEDNECPAGFDCTPQTVLGSEQLHCTPSSGECTCSAYAMSQQNSTECHVTTDAGTCPGTRSCTAEGLSACSAPEPVDGDCP